jgi:hypothetical protein
MRQVKVEVRRLASRAGERPRRGRRAEPTAERIRQAGTDLDRGHTGQVTMRDTPLERALARNVITQDQYSAAQKFRHHWYHAGLADPLRSLDLERIFAPDLGAYSGMAKTERQLFHRQRYREAVQAIGKIGAHVLEWAVCRDVPLEQVGYTLGWTTRAQAYAAAAERTKMAVEELCKLWAIGCRQEQP